MHTVIEKDLQSDPIGQEAERILRSCVHCGFCTASCPTYRLLGDDLDSPRGRIYLIKSMLEGEAVTHNTMTHLDRCLSCRACETACPSGVEYAKLLDIGRYYIEKRVSRSWFYWGYRFLILQSLPYQKRFKILLKLGQIFRVLFPANLKKMIPPPAKKSALIHTKKHKRRVILFKGCVQPALAPEINQSVIEVLDHFGIAANEVDEEQCCGALSQHLNDRDQALAFMRKNIDLFWPFIEQGIEGVIISASGCGVHFKEYAYLLREDKEYAMKAMRVSALVQDISEYMVDFDLEKIKPDLAKKIAFQSPCTLQHGQKLNGVIETILMRLGYQLTEVQDGYLCCGSAGTYSLMQNEISKKLRADKIVNLMQGQPELILTANIGCYHHLQQVSPVPIKHWIEEVATLIH